MYGEVNSFLRMLSISLLIGLFSHSAFSSVVIVGTRVIYPANQKEVTVKLNNDGNAPVVIQSWIDRGEINTPPEKLDIPFVITPPINRVESHEGQTLRISFIGDESLPKNKESVFWLNVLEIPAKVLSTEKQNHLQMAFRSRIKLFYRPVGLLGNPNEAAKSLIWTKVPEGLKASNPTPFHVSLVSVGVNLNGKKTEVEGHMISPEGSLTFALPKDASTTQVDIEYIDDYGAINILNQFIKSE